jgi:4-diphosphocytidyl-2-C-methyl-D-erythritol kinase
VARLDGPSAIDRTLAPAKLNLYLDVLGRRPDGYHDLETLFLPVGWGDDLEVSVRDEPGVELDLEGDAPAGDENLAVRAARAWLDAVAERERGARIRLVKRVPMGAGLGGGSSDAGAVLRLLCRQAGTLRDRHRLHEVARGLGADVPFFLLDGRPAVGRGRGDELEALPVAPPLQVVLILPPFGTSTAEVFAHSARRIRPAPPDGLARAVEALRSGEPARVRDAHYNALAGPAMTAYPDLRRYMVEVERRLGRPPMLTGSGSGLYDVPDAGTGEEVLARLEGIVGRQLLVGA